MLKRLFGSSREASPVSSAIAGPTAAAATAPLPARPAPAPVGEGVPPPLPELPLPSAAELAERWRQDVARACLDLRERHPTLEHGHGERLLVKIAVDLEFSVRQ